MRPQELERLDALLLRLEHDPGRAAALDGELGEGIAQVRRHVAELLKQAPRKQTRNPEHRVTVLAGQLPRSWRHGEEVTVRVRGVSRPRRVFRIGTQDVLEFYPTSRYLVVYLPPGWGVVRVLSHHDSPDEAMESYGKCSADRETAEGEVLLLQAPDLEAGSSVT